MKVSELCEKMGWQLLCGSGQRHVTGCYIGDLLSRVMGRCGENHLWITVQTSSNMLAVADLVDAAAVLFPEGTAVSAEIKLAAEEQEITLVSCRETAFEAACLVGEALK